MSFEASGDAAIDFWSRGRSELPKAWEVFAASAAEGEDARQAQARRSAST